LIEILLMVLVVARLMHPFGVLAAPGSTKYMFRGGAASATSPMRVSRRSPRL
jgi:hypothetical protein